MKYQKAKTELEIDTLKITLPVSVAEDKSGAFFVYFRANGYTKKGIIGAYNYTFETLKAEENVRNLRIGISTDSDLFLKGAKGEVAYRFEDAALESFAKTGAQTPEASTAIDSYVNQIGQGTVMKTASNLASLESYTVKGTYADSRMKLYGTEIFTALIVLLAAGILIFGTARFVLKRVNKAAEVNDDRKSGAISSNSQSVLLILGVSFISSILILFYTIFVFFLGNFLQRIISYQFTAFITIFLVLISFVIYSLILFAPGIYIGIKKGVGWGVGEVVMTLFWLILYFIVAIFVIFILFGSDYYPGPIVPLMSK